MCSLPYGPVVQLYNYASGLRVEGRLDELRRSQWLDRESLLKLQRRKLYSMLTYAQRFVPYYRNLFDQNGFRPDDVLADLSSFERLPVLTKEFVRQNMQDLLTTDPEKRSKLIRKTTSGSTGKPLVFMRDQNDRRYATADRFRHLEWAGWEPNRGTCYIWGTASEIEADKRPLPFLRNLLSGRFFTNAYVLSEESMNEFAADIRDRRPSILFGFPACEYRFAQFVEEHKMDDIKFEAIFSSGEILYPYQRQQIERTFGGKVFNHYGAEEAGGIGCECGLHTGFHISAERNYIEILKDDRPAAPGEVGTVVVTNLVNFGMPFIRYALEDLAAWSLQDACPCGRSLPVIEVVAGRRVDVFRTSDGKQVRGALLDSLFEVEEIRQFQVIQKATDLVVIRIVRDRDLGAGRLEAIEREVKSALGASTAVQFEFPDKIETEESGKYRYAKCEVGVE